MWNMKSQQHLVAAALGLAGALITSCGSQAYQAGSTSLAQAAPGTFQIAAKVDIVLAQEDMGSMYEAYNQLATQFPGFLNQLQSSGWDYHFTVVPLTTQVSPLQAVASQYDANWGSSWISPYPGAVEGSPGQGENLSASLFSTPSSFGGFAWANTFTSNVNNGQEYGLLNITQNLLAMQGASSSTNLIRNDALLVVVVLSNEDDSSGVTYCPRSGDGLLVPCNGTYQSSLNTYQQEMLNLKGGNASGVKFYAAVANEQNYNESCLGGNSAVGTRYQAMASMLGGQSYDICTSQISGVLSSLSSSLQAVRMSYETKYLFIASAPNLSTLTVTKYPGGDTSNPQVIPQSSTNGWTYDGQLTNVYAIDSPIPMNLSSGYAIELHGAAKLEGNDTAVVNFTPANLQNTAG
ncbi:MAG: hypothetical protein P4M08_15440 [Oligoflexia bacterium]|nr:hypothetical protein [Oligoflexia bacterium]